MTIGLMLAWLVFGWVDQSWVDGGTSAPTQTEVVLDDNTPVRAMDGPDTPPPPKP